MNLLPSNVSKTSNSNAMQYSMADHNFYASSGPVDERPQMHEND